MKQIIKINCIIEVSFESYSTKKLNDKAIKHIKRWIKETQDNELSYIPILIEKDEYGTYIEDSTNKTKITIK